MIHQLTFKDKVKTVSIINLGAVLEWFEFCLYGYLTTYLNLLFFPKEDQVVAMITVFGIFAASYIMRPLGGFVLGSIGDRFGRRYAIRLSMILMCIPMLLMTVMPTYQSAGIWAILILLFARMLQGFSVGGEYTGILVALAESASDKYRGLTTALAGLASQIGVILSATTVGILSSLLTKQQMLAYGWRIAFFIGLILAISSTILQKKAKESPFFKEMKNSNKVSESPLKDAICGPKMPLVWTFVLTGYVGIAYYMMATFLPNILISDRGFDVNKIMFITVAVSCFYAAVSPLFGWLSDIYGRKPLLYIPIVLLAVFGYPMFIFFNKGGLGSILVAEVILAIIISAMTASFQITVAELFPTDHRYSGMSAAYNTGNALFAGTTPMICVWLSGVFNSSYAPSFYLIISSIITLALIYKMPETRHSQEFEII